MLLNFVLFNGTESCCTAQKNAFVPLFDVLLRFFLLDKKNFCSLLFLGCRQDHLDPLIAALELMPNLDGFAGCDQLGLLVSFDH